jgi:hypothetical protein
MKHLRPLLTTWAALLLALTGVAAQTTEPAAETEESPAAEAEAAEPAEFPWSLSATAYTYIVQDDRVYVQPTIAADRNWLHLELRYNYEDQDTGSGWVGYNFSIGEKLAFELTPMLGGVFGHTDGIAPGYKASLSYWKLNLYTEGEYVIDLGDTSDSFFYTWSELSIAPLEWFRLGLVVQRTKAYETDFDIQRGFFAGLTFDPVDLTTYVLNPDHDPTIVVGLGLHFGG